MHDEHRKLGADKRGLCSERLVMVQTNHLGSHAHWVGGAETRLGESLSVDENGSITWMVAGSWALKPKLLWLQTPSFWYIANKVLVKTAGTFLLRGQTCPCVIHSSKLLTLHKHIWWEPEAEAYVTAFRPPVHRPLASKAAPQEKSYF